VREGEGEKEKQKIDVAGDVGEQIGSKRKREEERKGGEKRKWEAKREVGREGRV